jgi:predicted TIM-barrel fold metal-dependent hydrolase
MINDSFAALVSVHPTCMAAYASLPLPHIDESLEELDRAARLPGVLGVTLHCSVLDQSVAAADFDPIYEELNRRAAIAFLHPCRNGVCSALINDYHLAEAVGTSVEDSVAVLHMVARQIPHRYPRIRFIVPHLGGLLPMLLERLDNQMPRAHPHLLEPPSATVKRFWYDTVSHGSAAALRCARDALGSERLLPGSDYPLLLYHQEYGRAFSYIEAAGLASADVARILRHNAAALFEGVQLDPLTSGETHFDTVREEKAG